MKSNPSVTRCHARLVAVERQLHALGDPLEGGEYRLRASAAYQDWHHRRSGVGVAPSFAG